MKTWMSGRDIHKVAESEMMTGGKKTESEIFAVYPRGAGKYLVSVF